MLTISNKKEIAIRDPMKKRWFKISIFLFFTFIPFTNLFIWFMI